jgi:hypothetical protein
MQDPPAPPEAEVATPSNLDKLAQDSDHEVPNDQLDVTIECVPKNTQGEFMVRLTNVELEYFTNTYKFDPGSLQSILSASHSDLLLEKTRIGDGTFSVVYAATDKNTKTQLAIKFPRMNLWEFVLQEVKIYNKILKAVSKSGRASLANAYKLLALPRDMFWIVQNGKRVQMVFTMDLME